MKLTKLQLYTRLYYKKNKSRIDKNNREYAKKNPQRMRDATRRYKENHPHMVLWGSIYGRCKKEKIKINFNKNYFYNWYLNIKKVCEYCGITEINWVKSKDSLAICFKKLQVDRINPKLGYMKNNIVLACMRCNLTKSDFFDYKTMKFKIGKIINATR